MKKISNFFGLLIDARSSKSSRAFFMLGVLGVALLLLCIIGFVIMYDVLADGKVDTDLMGVSTLVTAIGVNLGLAGLVKSFGNLKNDENE